MKRLSLVLLFGVLPVAALAQAYPGITPLPRTTDPGRMQALATQREVVERMKAGFRAEEKNDWKKAALEFQRVVTLNPAEPQASTAFYDLGIARARLHDYDAAATAFTEAIALDPGFLAARANLVATLLMQGDLVRGRAAADAFVAAAPESARAQYARGIVAIRAGDAATALADFQKLSENDPAYAVAHFHMALAERQLGRYGDAERELRTALRLAPGYSRASIALGAILLHEGKRVEARAAFDGAVKSAPDVALRDLAASLRDALGP